MQAATKKRRTIDDGNVEPKMRTVPNDQLETAKAFMISMFRQGLGDVKKEWRMLSDEWKSDPDIALAATTISHQRSAVEVEDLPEQLLQNHDFLVQLMKQRGELWVDFPLAAQDDVSLVDAIAKFHSEKLVLAIFDRFPRLITDRSFWLKVVAGYGSRSVALPLLGEHAPPIILRDSEVALKACLRHNGFLELVDGSLWQQRNFVEGVVNNCADIRCPLQYIPDHAQLRWPELVVRCFEYKRDPFYMDECVRWAMDVANELWQQGNRIVVKGWFRAGFPFLGHFHTLWKDDREIFLLIAEHC